MDLRTKILFEDTHILVIHKPAGLATQAAGIGQSDVVNELKNYLAGKATGGKQTGGKPPYLGIIHRLDQPVEGILVFAKTKQAAAGLSGQIQKGLLHKQYLALVEGCVQEEPKTLTDYLIKDGRVAKVVGEDTPEAKKAVLSYRSMAVYGEAYSLVEVTLETGRFHQIRVQLSGDGHSLLGDLKYGSEHAARLGKELGLTNVALCAYKLTIKHPVTGKTMSFQIEPSFLAHCKSAE